MRVSTLIGLTAGMATQAYAACSGPLKIDDFSKYSSHTNSLQEWTSDDDTMASISASNNVLSFKPKSGSYFYESFACQAATNNGYNTVQFAIKGPAGGSATLEIQTKTSCSAGIYSSKYISLTGLTGNTQTITVPLSQFTGANNNAIQGFVWSGFSSNTFTWQLSNINFGCGSTGVSSSFAASSVVVRTSSVAVSSSSAKASSSAAASSSAKASSTPVSSSVKSSSAAVSSSAKSSSVTVSSSVKSSSSVASVKSSSASVSSSVVRTTSTVSASRSTLVTSSSAAASATGTCKPLLIDDFISQSRLTFLFYNSLDYPTSDDGSAKSVTVGKPSSNRVEIVPNTGGGTYFYSQFPCVNAKTAGYTGISLRIKAPKGATLNVELDSSDNCDPTSTSTKAVTKSAAELGWTFDGTEKLYLIPFSKFSGLNTEKLVTILFGFGSQTVSFGPMEFYCGATGEYIPSTTAVSDGPTSTVAAPSNTAASGLVIDKFASADSNALGFWHGADDGMTLKYASSKLTITSSDADYSYYTQVSAGCSDFSKYKGSYLHIAYSGSTKFTVSFQQHNSACNSDIAPFPETWDSVEASRYASNGNIYIPINHFNINLSRVVGFALKGFYTSDPVTLSLIEIVSSVPSGVSIPSKDSTGNLIFACKRPNSFAFAIDDGTPNLAQDVLKIIRDAGIHVTFFTVGAPLLDQSTNLTNVYKEMQAAGHQLAMHSFTHPKMEGLPDYASIDWEYNNDVAAMKSQFNGFTTSYFRPPFGTEGARMRSRLTKAVGDQATITNWSVDVEDWLWAETSTPEQQLVSFQRDVDKGGNLVVLHYLYPSTVSYLKQFIDIAKATGKDLMRVDQCMEDPNAPPYVKGQ